MYKALKVDIMPWFNGCNNEDIFFGKNSLTYLENKYRVNRGIGVCIWL